MCGDSATMESPVLIREVDVKGIMTKSNLPLGGYSANPYVGCTHSCRYCYASFMKRFTGHDEPWGSFLDVKHWPDIRNPRKYAGKRVVIGSVTDGYIPQEQEYRRTRALLEQLQGSGAKITICTKSDLVLRDLDLLEAMGDVTVSWSVNTLDDSFRSDMDRAASIERRLAAMERTHGAGLRTVCFVSPVFPGITDVRAIIERTRGFCDFVWLENLNLRGGFKKDILEYVGRKHPDLSSLYDDIYRKGNREYWRALERELRSFADERRLPWVDGRFPDGRSEPGCPTIVNYFYHEEVRGSENSGVRRRGGR